MIESGGVRKSLTQIAALMLAAIFIFASQVILARELSVYEFGQISSLYSVSSVLGVFASFGFGSYLLNSKLKGKKYDQLVSMLKVSTVWMSFFSSIFLSLYWLISGDVFLWCLPFIVFIFYQSLNNLAFAVNQSNFDYKKVALNRLEIPFVRCLSSCALFFCSVNLYLLVLAGFCIFFVRKLLFVKLVSSHASVAFNVTHLKNGFIYGVESFCSVFLLNICAITMGIRGEFSSLAAVNVGFSFILAAYLVPQGFFINYLYPKIVYMNEVDPKGLYSTLAKYAVIAAVIGLLGVLITYLVAHYLILFFYGDNYLDISVEAMIILSCSLPFRYFLVAFGGYISTYDSIRYKLTSSMIAIASFFYLLVYLLQVINPVEAYSWSFVASQAALAGSYMFFSYRKYCRK